MSRKTFVTGLLLMMTVCTASLADGIEITPAVGYRFGGQFYDYFSRTEFNIKDDATESITLGIELNEDVTIEAHWNNQDTRIDFRGSLPPLLDTDGIDVEYWHAGVMMRPGDGDRVEPFVVVSAGVTRFKPHASGTSNDTRFSLSGGGGIRAMFGEHFGLRLQGRLYVSFVHGSAAAICGGGGCSFGYSGDGLWQADFSAGAIIAF